MSHEKAIYKRNIQDVLNRLRSLYEERDQSKIFAVMNIPNKHLQEFKNIVWLVFAITQTLMKEFYSGTASFRNALVC